MARKFDAERAAERYAPAEIEARARWAAVLGEDRLHARIAAVFKVGSTALFQWLNSGFPDYTMLVLDVIEKTPARHWPRSLHDRVAEARSI